MKHNNGVVYVREPAPDLLKNDGGGGCGVIDKRDLVKVGGVD